MSEALQTEVYQKNHICCSKTRFFPMLISIVGRPSVSIVQTIFEIGLLLLKLLKDYLQMFSSRDTETSKHVRNNPESN